MSYYTHHRHTNAGQYVHVDVTYIILVISFLLAHSTSIQTILITFVLMFILRTLLKREK